jgi:transposase InsO family protein
MKEWVTAKEIAGAAEDVANTHSGVVRQAKREGWRTDKRQGRGGGRVYHLDSLPAKARAALVRQHGPAPSETSDTSARGSGFYEYDPDELARWGDACNARQRAEGVERAQILNAAMDMHERSGYRLREALHAAAAAADRNPGTVKNWYYGTQSMRGAQYYRRCDWMYALIPRYVGRTATAEMDPAAWQYLLGDYLRLSGPSLAACYRRLQKQAREHGWQIPAKKTVTRRIEREIPRETIVYYREGEDAVARMVESGPRDRSMFRALEAANADGHQLDVICRWPDGTTGRPYLTAIQDLYSNRFIGWHLSATENADAYRLALARSLRWGIPNELYLDNPRAASSKMLSGRAQQRFRWPGHADDPEGLFGLLGLTVHYVLPFSGQSKPIERAFRDLIEQVAKHPRCEGAYVGSSTEKKPANHRTATVPIDEMESIVAAGIREYNEREGRRTRVAAGRSFDAVFLESYERYKHLIERPTQAQKRRLLLANRRVTAAHKSGAVEVEGNVYWSEALAGYARLPKQRRQLIACYDPDALGEGIHVYTLDGREVGHAEVRHLRFDCSQDAQRHGREKARYKRAAREQASAAQRMREREVASRNQPEPDDSPDEPPDIATEESNVVRGAFGRHEEPVQKAAGSDVEPNEEGGGGADYQHAADDMLLAHFERLRHSEED